MYEAIAAVLKFAFGFISNKLRTYGAEKLQDGDLADEKVRGWIVRELDDIKFKLDAISRKDLFLSISCLQQGVKRLILFAGESFKTGNSPVQINPSKDQKQFLTKTTEHLVTVEYAVALARAIGEMKIESNERFLSAKQSFTKAAEKASEAFHNASLSLNERILASKVRIASGILENVDDLQVAASDCLHYLQELHNMSAVKGIFSVHVQGGLKSLFKKDSRGDMIDTITMINLLLADFISKFTKLRMGVLDWPMIACGKRVIHPIHYERESVRKMREIKIRPPWDIAVNEKPNDTLLLQSFAIDGEADVIRVFNDDYHPRKLDRATGEWKPLNPYPSSDSVCYSRSVAIDDNNTIYVLSCEYVACNLEENLSVYNSDGTIMHHRRPLNFTKEGAISGITVTKGKKIVFCCFKGLGCSTGMLYVCNVSGELIASFPICLNSPFERVLGLFVSHDTSADDDITVATGRHTSNAEGVKLYVYTQAGMFKRTATLRHTSFGRAHYKVSFDNVTNNYIICSAALLDKIVNVAYVSATGELRNSLFLDGDYIIHDENIGFLISHTNGVTALVNSNCVFYLQSSSMRCILT